MSTLSVDTITGKSTSTNLTIGSTPVVSSSANSLTIRGEGSAQTSIQQGLCKAWIAYSLSTTSPVVADSFNLTVQTDHAAGDTTYAITNNMATARGYTVSGKMGPDGDTTAFIYSPQPLADDHVLTSSLRITANYVGASASGSGDYHYVSNNIHGDLA